MRAKEKDNLVHITLRERKPPIKVEPFERVCHVLCTLIFSLLLGDHVSFSLAQLNKMHGSNALSTKQTKKKICSRATLERKINQLMMSHGEFTLLSSHNCIFFFLRYINVPPTISFFSFNVHESLDFFCISSEVRNERTVENDIFLSSPLV